MILFLFSLLLTLCFSMFFAASEASLLRLNRYEIQAEKETWTQKMLLNLIDRIDEVLIVILLGNTFGNIFAASILSVYLAENDFSQEILWLAPVLLTITILIFGEVLPKTLATLEPKKIGRLCVWLLHPMMIFLKPIIWIIKIINNFLLGRLGVHEDAEKIISFREYKSMIADGLKKQNNSYQQMMLSALELHELRVNHIMLPISKIEFLDLNDQWSITYQKILNTPHRILPVIRGSFQDVIGFLKPQECLKALINGTLSPAFMEKMIRSPYFIPEKMTLSLQYQQFHKLKESLGLVVNEYGDIVGLLGINDILNYLALEDLSLMEMSLHEQTDSGWIVRGDLSLSSLRRLSGAFLPSKTATTIGGALLEHWEDIPAVGSQWHHEDYIYEILQIHNNQILKIKITKYEENQDLFSS